MELYCVISITDRIAAADILRICHDLDLSFTLTNLGRGTATSEHLNLNDLESSEKTVVSAFADGEDMRKMLRLAKIRLFMDIPGNGIMMAIPVKSVGGTKTLSFLTKGTGHKKAVKFFGVSLAEEKDMIYIVSPASKKAKIMNAIEKAAGTETDAGAFCFSLPISEVAGLRKFDGETDGE